RQVTARLTHGCRSDMAVTLEHVCAKTVRLPAGEPVPAFGIGTWRLGENRHRRAEEIETVKLALDLGARLIDTAEMYGDGLTEELIGEAIRGRRDEVFL